MWIMGEALRTWEQEVYGQSLRCPFRRKTERGKGLEKGTWNEAKAKPVLFQKLWGDVGSEPGKPGSWFFFCFYFVLPFTQITPRYRIQLHYGLNRHCKISLGTWSRCTILVPREIGSTCQTIDLKRSLFKVAGCLPLCWLLKEFITKQ